MRPPLYNAQQLNTPGKRLGYVALLVGAFTSLLTLALFLVLEFEAGSWGNVWHGLFFGWLEQFWRDWNKHWYLRYRQFCYGGAATAALGWLLSYGYERTVGSFVRWVRSGEQ